MGLFGFGKKTQKSNRRKSVKDRANDHAKKLSKSGFKNVRTEKGKRGSWLVWYDNK